jgi:geranylgeranyl diphosphate synthase type I
MHTASAAGLAERVEAILARYRPPVLDAMHASLAIDGIEHVRLMRRHLGWEDETGVQVRARAGKMLRPALCLLTAEAAGGAIERALPAAVAIELLHNFTLIHDDIEDRSDTRHGRPTLWRETGEALAINAGDGMFVLARAELLRLAEAGLDAGRTLRAARMLDDACLRLCEGQHLDLTFESRPAVLLADYEAMVRGKSAALIGAAMGIGALAVGSDNETIAACQRCGDELGMALQVRDDALGVWGAPEVTGKPASDDIRSRKKSFPVIHAFQHLNGDAKRRLGEIYESAEASDAEVREVRQLLEQAGSREAAAVEARLHAQTAVDAIRAVQLDAGRRDDIEAIAAFVVEREA